MSLFLDISGFSTMTDTLMQHGQNGAEVLANLMHGVFDPLVENIFHYGGKIVSFAGDGIMALFPVEAEEKSMALHALTAAWTIQNALLANPARQTAYGNFHFSVKIGIALGSVSWGILRSRGGAIATYYFRGSAVDQASYAEHRARAGQIILTDEIWTLLRDELQTAPHASFHRLDGFTIELPDPTPIAFPEVDLEISRLFMPEEVITQNVRGEFRQIVNLFMRFPDLPHAELQKLSEVVFELHDQYGGLINRLDFGDKGCNMLILWGAPVTYENDIGRALNFILDLKARLSFPVTAGVTYYIAHAGYLGSSMCEDYTCYGWGVNLASRLMMSAPDGGVWTDERVARRVKNRFDFEYLGSQPFKGFAAEEKVYSIHGRKLQELFFQGEFVGREAELPRLIDFVQPLWQGRFAGLTVVWGEAGMGKSRLMYEFKAALAHRRKKFLWAPCNADQILRHSFNPFRYWLFRYFEIDPTLDNAVQVQTFDTKLNDLIENIHDPELADELGRLRTVLGSLVDLRWSESFYEQLDAEGRYNNTLNALIALIKAASLRQPVLLILEDAHFLDEDSKAFLPRLKRSITTGSDKYPIMILVCSRPEGRDTLELLTAPLVDHSIDLGGISVQALSELAEIYLGGVASPDLNHLLKDRSEGNPYFAEQILIYLKEENLLEMSRTGWRVKRHSQETALPADILALLISRLDQLPRRVRDVIQTAAVLGREFSIQPLVRMMEDDPHLPNDIAEAEQAHVWLAISPFQYFFTHALVRDAAYAMQTQASRMELHALALDAMEKVYGADVHHHHGELAHHAERAGLSEKAYYYLRHAAKAAADAYQNSEAVDYYTRALAFVDPDDLTSQYDLLAERVELYSRIGKRDLQLKDLNALDRWAQELGNQDRIAKMLMLRAAYRYFIGEYLNSIRYIEQAERYPFWHTNDQLVFYTQIIWLSALHRLGRLDETMQRAEEMLTKIQTSGNRKQEARVLNVMGLTALEQKASASAQSYLMRALAIAREFNDPDLESSILNNLANSAAYTQRDYPAARAYYEQAYTLATKLGDRYQQGNIIGNIGWVCSMLGDLTSAQKCYEQALLIVREIGNLNYEILTLLNLSGVAEIQGRAEDAVQLALDASSLSKQTGDQLGDAWSYLYLGHAYALLGQLDRAKTAFERALKLRNALNQPALAAEPKAGLILMALRTEDTDLAGRLTEELLLFFKEGGTLDGTEQPLRVYLACYDALVRLADPRATQILETAMQLLEGQTSKINNAQIRRMYIENIPWRRAIEQLWLEKQGKG